MHPALIKLLRLRGRALSRRLLRGIRSPRGIIFAVIGGVIIASWVLSAVVGIAFSERGDPARVTTYMPLILLAFFLLFLLGGAGRQSLLFSPSEVDFLFPGPFTRRDLLFYKITGSTIGIALSSLFILIFSLRHANHWLGAIVGTFLALQFVHLLSMFIGLMAQTASARLAARARWIILAAIAAALILAAFQAAPNLSAAGVVEFIEQARQTPAARILLAPFAVHAAIFTAPDLWPEATMWAAIGAAMNIALIGLIIWSDRDFLESAAASSRTHYDRMMKAAHSGGLRTWDARRAAKMRLPRPPRMGGVGPILHRQMLNALRASRGLVVTLVLLLVVAGVLLRNAAVDESLLGLLFGACAYITFFLSMMLRFDFRGDIDHMDLLKSLPLRAEAIVLGELLTPVLMVTVFQCGIVALAYAFVADLPWWVIVVPPFGLVLNLLWLEMENVFFLLYPTRRAFAGPADIQMMGRGIVIMMAKLFIVGLMGAACAGLGVVGWIVTGGSWAVTIGIGWLGMVAIGAAMVPAVATAFRRFDVSRDIPG